MLLRKVEKELKKTKKKKTKAKNQAIKAVGRDTDSRPPEGPLQQDAVGH